MKRTSVMRPLSPLSVASSVVLSSVLAALPAHAAEAPPQNVVGLSANASVEVTKDLMSVTLSTTRDGADAGAVQAALKQALDAALTEAKKAAKPGQIDVQTGNFSLFPRYASKGGITGWQGTAELVIEGRDIPGIAKLTGRITTMTIARVGTSLSREQREKVEADVAAQAIARYRAKAADYSKQFGFSSYTLREVTINSNEPVMYEKAQMMRQSTMASASADSLPVELGKGIVTVSVNGTVQLTK